jgi:hypothetical protein
MLAFKQLFTFLKVCCSIAPDFPRQLIDLKGSCTLAKFAGKNVRDSHRWQTDYVIALVTLGGATKNRNDPISVTPIDI